MSGFIARAMLATSIIAVAGCGGGGGGGGGTVASISSSAPPPAPTSNPTPTPASTALIPSATTTQQFAVMGETVIDGSGPTVDPGTQIKISYDAVTQSYQVLLPDEQQWEKLDYLSTSADGGPQYRGSSFLLGGIGGDYSYSRLIEWNDGANSGRDAVGVATPGSGVPVTGNANYLGQISGLTSDHHGTDFGVDGTIDLSFNFGLGTLSGSINATTHEGYAIGSLNFRNTIYSSGGTSFSGGFDTSIAGANSFSGIFTGPHAEELIGNFTFPYRSPLDAQIYRADGAFIAKH